MNIIETIKAILKETGQTKRSIANAEHISPQLINNRLNRGSDMQVASAVQLLRGCGYKIVVMPRGERVKDGWYEVE